MQTVALVKAGIVVLSVAVKDKTEAMASYPGYDKYLVVGQDDFTGVTYPPGPAQ